MKSFKILIFISAVIAALAAVCVFFPKGGATLFGKRLFFPSLDEIMLREKSSSAAEKLAALESSLRMQFVADSLATEKGNLIKTYQKFFQTSPLHFDFPDDDLAFFNPFFAELDSCHIDSSLVHILHYGDSQIEADRISGTFRQKLQERFGGIGAGLQPAVQLIPSAAVGQANSDSLARYIISGMHANRAAHNRYGVMGQMAEINGAASISFSARKWAATYENTKKWTTVRLFINRNQAGFSAKLSSGKFSQIQTLKAASDTPRVIVWELNDSVSKAVLAFSGTAEVAGVSLDGDFGVTVDNIPLRGSSGTFFSQIDGKSLALAMQELNVRLILLEFGGNALPAISTEKAAISYAETIGKQIVYLHKLHPQAKIVLLGPADTAKRVNGKLQTDPMLPVLVDALKNAATDNGAAFWNMYEVMGGNGSMIEWTQASPALASTDYIHFTVRGAEKMGGLLWNAVEKYYEYYKISGER